MTLIKKLTKNCCISLIQREDLQTKIGLNFLTQSLPGPNLFSSNQAYPKLTHLPSFCELISNKMHNCTWQQVDLNMFLAIDD